VLQVDEEKRQPAIPSSCPVKQHALLSLYGSVAIWKSDVTDIHHHWLKRTCVVMCDRDFVHCRWLIMQLLAALLTSTVIWKSRLIVCTLLRTYNVTLPLHASLNHGSVLGDWM